MDNILKDEDFKRKFPIKLVKHNSEWINLYEDEKTNLLDKLNKYNISLHHIGSTAIPNIYSKDIIDIILEINESDDFDSIIDILNVEWELRWKEDNRAFLVKGYVDVIVMVCGITTTVSHNVPRVSRPINTVKRCPETLFPDDILDSGSICVIDCVLSNTIT